jgi:penicillin-binding protein 1A
MGTAARAMRLGRSDLAGKTGTTNDFVDAWFCGFNHSLVGIAWLGFDQPQTLGRNETGGNAALPIWMSYMATVLKGVVEQPFNPPPGVLAIRVNPDTGLRVSEGGVVDFFYQEYIPPEDTGGGIPVGTDRPEDPKSALF